MRYESNPKHSQPWQPGRRGSLCPPDIDREEAQAMLAGSEAVGARRYAARHGVAYRAQEHSRGVWHGHPVGWGRVPESLRRRWIRERRVRRRDVGRHWEG